MTKRERQLWNACRRVRQLAEKVIAGQVKYREKYGPVCASHYDAQVRLAHQMLVAVGPETP